MTTAESGSGDGVSSAARLLRQARRSIGRTKRPRPASADAPIVLAETRYELALAPEVVGLALNDLVLAGGPLAGPIDVDWPESVAESGWGTMGGRHSLTPPHRSAGPVTESWQLEAAAAGTTVRHRLTIHKRAAGESWPDRAYRQQLGDRDRRTIEDVAQLTGAVFESTTDAEKATSDDVTWRASSDAGTIVVRARRPIRGRRVVLAALNLTASQEPLIGFVGRVGDAEIDVTVADDGSIDGHIGRHRLTMRSQPDQSVTGSVGPYPLQRRTDDVDGLTIGPARVLHSTGGRGASGKIGTTGAALAVWSADRIPELTQPELTVVARLSNDRRCAYRPRGTLRNPAPGISASRTRGWP
ncbi:MAG: hypothetical protein AAGA42_15075 [Actinomycetota bacterium]